MIVDAPFIYELPYVPHRARNKRTAIVKDSAPIEIAEASASEAPVALKVDAGRFSRTWTVGAPRDYRFWNGAFWRPYSIQTEARRGNKENNARYAPMPVKELVRQTAAGGGPFGNDNSGWRLNRAVELNSLMPCRFMASPDALREQVIRDLQQTSADILVVDGIAYHRVSEPVFRVKKWGSFEQYHSIEVTHVADIKPEDDPEEFFRADRFDDAVARYESRSGEKFTKKSAKDIAERRIEVLLPETLSFRYDMRPRVLREAKEILSWMKSDLAEKDLAFAAAFIHLRDATKDETPVDHGAVAEMVGNEVAKAMRDNGSAGWMIDRAESLLTDWHNREDPSLIRDGDLAALAL